MLALLADTRIVYERGGPIHWEAVLLTAVPATIAGVFSVAAARIARRAARVGQANKEHLVAIDAAVNGVEPGQPSLREKVEAIADATPGAEAAGHK